MNAAARGPLQIRDMINKIYKSRADSRRAGIAFRPWLADCAFPARRNTRLGSIDNPRGLKSAARYGPAADACPGTPGLSARIQSPHRQITKSSADPFLPSGLAETYE